MWRSPYINAPPISHDSDPITAAVSELSRHALGLTPSDIVSIADCCLYTECITFPHRKFYCLFKAISFPTYDSLHYPIYSSATAHSSYLGRYSSLTIYRWLASLVNTQQMNKRMNKQNYFASWKKLKL